MIAVQKYLTSWEQDSKINFPADWNLHSDLLQYFFIKTLLPDSIHAFPSTFPHIPSLQTVHLGTFPLHIGSKPGVWDSQGAREIIIIKKKKNTTYNLLANLLFYSRDWKWLTIAVSGPTMAVLGILWKPTTTFHPFAVRLCPEVHLRQPWEFVSPSLGVFREGDSNTARLRAANFTAQGRHCSPSLLIVFEAGGRVG